jgi:hypothetical protein
MRIEAVRPSTMKNMKNMKAWIGGALVLCAGLTTSAQVQMPDVKAMSGSVLPVSEIPAGTVTVRVVRGALDKNIAKQPVEFTIDGKVRTVATDESGRATVTGLRRGARVKAVAVVAGERLVSQDATVADAGLRILLVATDPDAAAREAESQALAAMPPVKGIVVLGGESRVVAEYSNDKLNVFYFVDVVNAARTPVDIGGPLLIDLPRSARGATVMEGSSKQATALGPRVTITGPFAPGTTTVQIGYELPYGGPTVRLEQRWPALLQETTVIVSKVGNIDASSPQFAKKDVRAQGDQAFILGVGPAIAAGQSLVLDITGLPHHPRWPRYLALTLAGVIMAVGIWAAVFTKSRA